MTDLSHTLYGQYGTDDAHFVADGGRLLFTTFDELAEQESYVVASWEDALVLGEWLIAHAISRGVVPRAAPAGEHTKCEAAQAAEGRSLADAVAEGEAP